MQEQIKKLKNYLKNTPFILIFVELINPLMSFIYSIYSFITKKYILLLPIFLFLFIFILYNFLIQKNYIKISNLKYENKAFLNNTIYNILEVKRIKSKERINPLNVDELRVKFTIEKSNCKRQNKSNLNIHWNIRGRTSMELSKYCMLCAKSDTRKNFEPPKIKITENNQSTYTQMGQLESETLYNYFHFCFKNGKLSKDTNVCFDFDVNDYYSYCWNDYEILIINPNIYGDSVKKLQVNITCEDEKIKGNNVILCKMGQDNFKRKNIQEKQLTKVNNKYTTEFIYDENDITNHCFLLVFPKCI